MKKAYELKNVDDFIEDFNDLSLGCLQRISGEIQENPDAICLLDGKIKIGLEATVVILPEDVPFSKIVKSENIAYNPFPAIEILIERIKEKSQNDYKDQTIDDVWLLISGGSHISDHDLKERLAGENINTKFSRIFIHKGIYPKIIEISKVG